MIGIKANAHDFYLGNIYYKFIDNQTAVAVTYEDSYNDPDDEVYSGAVTIPSSVTYNGRTYSVKAIGDEAFKNCPTLTSITIPSSVTSIGYRAFYYCSGLATITIPNSVTSIGGQAFSSTAWYQNKSDGLVYAGKVAYRYKGTMPSNTSITLTSGTKGIAGEAFWNCSGLKSITIPNTVTNIGDQAFYGCTSLTDPTIPSSVVSIGARAFQGCTSLVEMVIPNSVTSIGEYAFNSSGLNVITLPNSISTIEHATFAWCLVLVTMRFPNVPIFQVLIFLIL